MQQPPGEQGSRNSTDLSGELSSDAQQLGSAAADRIDSELDARKDQAARQAKSASSALRKAASELDQSSPEWLKSAFRQGADRIQHFADTMEHKDSRQLMHDAQDFARNNAGTFLAACAAAGFAAARIFRAGGEQQTSAKSGQQRSRTSAESQSRRGRESATPGSSSNADGGTAATASGDRA